MKLLVYADLQAHDGDERCFGDAGTSLQLYRVRKFFADLYDVYTEHECEGLVDLGDTTDDRSSIPVPVIDAVLGGLERFPASPWNFKIMGNHEQFVRDTSLDSGRLYGKFFEVFNRVEVRESGSTVYVFASYPDNHDQLAARLAEILRGYKGHRKVLFGHFQAVGATMPTGEALTGIPKAILNQFTVAMLGHIHLPQAVGKSIHYVGSPFQQHWGEAGQPKRVGVLDLGTLTITWVPMDGYPQYRMVSLKEFEESFREDSENRWKVRLANHAETEKFFQLPFSHRYEAIYEYTLETDPDVPAKEPTDWSLDASLAHWVNLMPPKKGNIDLSAEELIAIGRQLAS